MPKSKSEARRLAIQKGEDPVAAAKEFDAAKKTNYASSVLEEVRLAVKKAFHVSNDLGWLKTWSYNVDRKDFSREIGDETMAFRFHGTCEETGDDIFISIQRVPRGL